MKCLESSKPGTAKEKPAPAQSKPAQAKKPAKKATTK